MHVMNRSFFMETSVHQLTAEISELAHGNQLSGRKGLPQKFSIPGVGNGNPFIAINVERSEGDLLFVKYRQSLGCVEVTIFND